MQKDVRNRVGPTEKRETEDREERRREENTDSVKAQAKPGKN